MCNAPANLQKHSPSILRPYARPFIRRPRVLVADDNETSALALAWELEACGWETKACYNGREAIAMIHTFQPDAVLLDLGMPILGGLEACKFMREELGLCDTLIIAQTTWGDADSRRETFEAGFDLHLLKPLTVREVDREIRNRLPNRMAA